RAPTGTPHAGEGEGAKSAPSRDPRGGAYSRDLRAERPTTGRVASSPRRSRRERRITSVYTIAVLMQIALEPFPGQLRDLFQGAWFFKQVRCAGNDFELLISAQFGHRLPI